jgi:hypothetical protein
MQQSTNDFAAAVRGGAQYASRACIFLGDKLMEDTFYGGDSLKLLTNGSSVTYDRLSDTRSTADLRFMLETPDADYLLDPTRFPEVCVYSGIVFGSEIEWIEMGRFPVHTTVFERKAGLVAQCMTTDRSARIRDNSWRKPFQIASGSDYYAGMRSVVADRAKGFTPTYNHGSSSLTTPAMTFAETEDPWAVVLRLAESVGAEAYFDRQGGFAAFPIPDPKLEPPAVRLGPDSGIQISPITREVSNREVYNGVICRAEASWLLFPVSAEVWDEDPLSPSYRYGSFGEKPKVIGNSLATTTGQCLDAATAEFRKIAGVSEIISFQKIKDPRLEVGDIIEQLDDTLKITGRYVLDTYNYPLGVGNASGIVRRKR